MKKDEKFELKPDTIIEIRRQWNDGFIGTVKFMDIDGLHWDTISGGINYSSPRPFIHGYVMCDKIIGEISHSCRHGEGPHNIKVCLVKKDNDPKIWKSILKIVDGGFR